MDRPSAAFLFNNPHVNFSGFCGCVIPLAYVLAMPLGMKSNGTFL
jgi:hypothetical protein